MPKTKTKPAKTPHGALTTLQPNAAGADIGAREIYVAVPPDWDASPVRCFGTFTDQLRALVEHEYLTLDESGELYRAASYVLSQNLVHGDAMAMLTHEGEAITFAEWGYLGKGRFQRRDFRLDVLTQSSAWSAEGTLFAQLGRHDIFQPVKNYPPTTVSELAVAQGAEPGT